MKKIYLFTALFASVLTSQAQVVISQIFPAGGNSGAVIKDDYLELFNMGNTPQSFDGWYVQYASATGPSTTNNPTQKWIGVQFPDGLSIAPKSYFLIKLSVGASGTSLNTFDVDFSNLQNTGLPLSTNNKGILMGASAGKIAIINSLPELTGYQDPAVQGYTRPSNLVDLVGYGSTANGYENEGTIDKKTAPVSSVNTNAIFRVNSQGLVKDFDVFDNNDNSANFIIAPTNPRTTTYLSDKNFNSIDGLSIAPNPANTSLYITSNNLYIKELEVYDVSGKLVLKTSLTTEAVNVSSLQKGIYVAKIKENNKIATSKLIIE